MRRVRRRTKLLHLDLVEDGQPQLIRTADAVKHIDELALCHQSVGEFSKKLTFKRRSMRVYEERGGWWWLGKRILNWFQDPGPIPVR